MVAHIQTIAFQGVDALPVDVQVHLAPGQNAFNVVAAQNRQIARQNCLNARLDGDALREMAEPDAAGRKLLARIIEEGQMTARGFNRILRVARTLADIKGAARPDVADMATALQWRGMQMN